MKQNGIRPAIQVHYDVAKVALFLDRGTAWVRKQIRDGELRGFRLGSRLVVDSDSLHEFLDKREVTGSKRRESENQSEADS